MTQDLQNLTTKQAAKILGKSPSTIAHWRHKKIGPKYARIGGTIRYFSKDIEDYVASRTVFPQEEREE